VFARNLLTASGLRSKWILAVKAEPDVAAFLPRPHPVAEWSATLPLPDYGRVTRDTSKIDLLRNRRISSSIC
jgi:hypothetical protein